MWTVCFFCTALLQLVHVSEGWLCVQCTNATSEADCNSAGTVNCPVHQHSCETTYSVDLTRWSKYCQEPSNCTSYCSATECISCCVANRCNLVANLVTTAAPVTTVITEVSLSLSTGGQMAFLYIVFVLVAPLVISAIAAACWLAYFRHKRRKTSSGDVEVGDKSSVIKLDTLAT